MNVPGRHKTKYYAYGPTVRVSSGLRWVYIGIAAVCVVTFYLIYATIADTHGGHAFTQALCREVSQQRLSGDLCPDLCRDRNLQLTNFVHDKDGYRVFEWGNVLYKVKLAHIQHLEMAGGPESGLQHVYNIPSDGTRMEEFRNMVEELVASRLGQINYGNFLNKLLVAADVNMDSKISLGEAKTMWALLQHDEPFKMLLFSESEQIPVLQGFCGDLYALEQVENTQLYEKPSSSIKKLLFPQHYTWWFPSWPMRAKIIIGLLEFTLESYQHGSLGTFYMCNLSEKNIGYTRTHDVKLMNIGEVLSRQELWAYIGGKSCENSSDCVYTSHCTTVCDQYSKQCTTDLLQPNLSRVCTIIKPYVLKGAPRFLMGDLLHILDKCDHLEAGLQSLELEHALILNDLKLLLWKQISNSIA